MANQKCDLIMPFFSNGGKISGVILFVTIILVNTANFSAQNALIVRGRVINETGQPIKDAKVCLILPPCKMCLDQLVPCMQTEREGSFYLDSDTRRGESRGTLYIEGEAADGFRLIYDPSTQLSKLHRYRRVEFRIPADGGVIDLHDVKPTISYSSVTLNISKYIEKAEDLPDALTFRLRDVSGKEITKKQTIPRKHWTSPTTLDLLLPKDTWILDLDYSPARQGQRQKISILVDVSNDKLRIIQ